MENRRTPIKVDISKLHVVPSDEHFVLIQSDNEEAARRLEGKKLGDYETREKAHAALDTLHTIVALGYEDTLTFKDNA